MVMVQIVPTILTSSKQEFEEKLAKVSELVERVQIDVVDGLFVENKTVDLSEVSRADFLGQIDVHLMVDKPLEWVGQAAKFGADFLIGHIEKIGDQKEFVRQVKEKGMKAGLALDLGRAVKEIDKSLWGQLDGVLIMSVSAGFSGQVFDEKALLKVKKAKRIKDNLNLDFDIIVDGGVNLENAKKCVEAGADVLAVGSAIWDSENIGEIIKRLKEI